MLNNPQFLVDEASRLLKAPVTLEDVDFNLVAYGPHPLGLDDVRLRSILQRRTAPEMRSWFEQFGITSATQPVRTPRSLRHKALSRVCIPVRWNGDTCGYLWALDDRDALTAHVTEPVMRLAQGVGPMLAQRRCASAPPRAGAAERRQITNPVVVAVVRTRRAGEGLRLDFTRLAHRVAASQTREEATLVLPMSSPARTPRAEVEALLAEARESSEPAQDLVVGISDPQLDLGRVDTAVWQATHVAEVAAAIPHLGPVATWTSIGAMRLGALTPTERLGDALMTRGLTRLVRHQDRCLVQTARAFVEHLGDVAATAAELEVDEAVVETRMAQVGEVTGLDVDMAGHRLELHLALTLDPLLFRRLADIEGMGVAQQPVSTW